MKTTEKDILMLCKGHYNKEKHKSLEEALDAYYREKYDVSKEDIPFLTCRFMMELWFNQCIKTFLIPEKISEFWTWVIHEESLDEKNYIGRNVFGRTPVTDFYEVMHHRVVRWLSMMQVRDDEGNWIIDLSDYDGDVI